MDDRFKDRLRGALVLLVLFILLWVSFTAVFIGLRIALFLVVGG
jgi:hypothetical protein